MLNPQLIGILGLAAIAACWSLAVVLYRVGTAGSVTRKLALLLVIEGVTLLTGEFPELASGLVGLSWSFWESFYEQHPALYWISGIVHHLGDAAMIALYPAFLAVVLQTKLTRPFAGKRIRMGVAAVAVALFLGSFASYIIWDSTLGSELLYITLMLVFAFGLVASLQAWHAAEPGIARNRARVFAIAFGIRDIGWGISYAVSFWMTWTDSSLMDGFLVPMKLPYALGTLFAVPLIAYGILRAHLFDIDLKIRWTIKQSTLAGVFVALIFLISEGADRFLSAELGNFAGLLAAAVVVFFLAPLQRFAEGVATVAMPNTKNTSEYTTFRKMQVYEEAVSEAHFEGGISEKERALLVRLRDSLEISETDADAIEGEIKEHQPSFA